MDFEEDRPSTSSSSSSGQSPKYSLQLTTTVLKRKAGRRKFKETRHPVYRGVRSKNGSKWVCEVREPNKKSRIWLGTFPIPEMAARAHDVAALALRGDSAALNFPDSAWRLPRAKSSLARDIQIAAFRAAEAFGPSLDHTHDGSPSPLDCSSHPKSEEHTEDEPSTTNDNKVQENQNLGTSDTVDDSERVLNYSTTMFMDEEAMFNMPVLIDSMAEGMLLTPPAMKKGFHWDDTEDDFEFSLWKD